MKRTGSNDNGNPRRGGLQQDFWEANYLVRGLGPVNHFQWETDLRTKGDFYESVLVDCQSDIPLQSMFVSFPPAPCHRNIVTCSFFPSALHARRHGGMTSHRFSICNKCRTWYLLTRVEGD